LQDLLEQLLILLGRAQIDARSEHSNGAASHPGGTIGVTPNREKGRWVIKLKQRLRIFWLRAMEDSATDAPDRVRFLFRAPGKLLLVDFLRRRGRSVERFQSC
ncbi:MAG: hypothetical protein WBQ89_05155, partial [Candidatus Acidiferrum sp.]